MNILLEAWASRESFEPKKDPPQRGSGVRGRKLLRDLHESKTDPEKRGCTRRARTGRRSRAI